MRKVIQWIADIYSFLLDTGRRFWGWVGQQISGYMAGVLRVVGGAITIFYSGLAFHKGMIDRFDNWLSGVQSLFVLPVETATDAVPGDLMVRKFSGFIFYALGIEFWISLLIGLSYVTAIAVTLKIYDFVFNKLLDAVKSGGGL